MRVKLDTTDILSILSQMPSSILFKCPEKDIVYMSKGFERDFGMLQAVSVDANSFVFFDPETKAPIPPCNSPFALAEQGETVAQHLRLQTDSRAMNCFVESGVISTHLGDWVVLQIKTNVTAMFNENNKNSAVSKHIAFNQLLTNLSSKLITASINELDGIIDQALAALGAFCDVDRCYIFEFSDNAESMSNTHEWVAAGVTPFIDELQNMPTSSLPFFKRYIFNGMFKVDNVEMLPEEAAAEKIVFDEQRIFSVLCVRIMVDEIIYGFIGCDIIGSPYSWNAFDIEYLRRIGEMLGNTLQSLHNRKALQKAQAELLEANKQLERLANIDGLSGIANRRLFDSTLLRDVERCNEQGLALSLLLIDVDFFKQFNDAYGHVAGDEALKKIADTLTNSCVGSDDLVARYGGEEFAVILPSTGLDELHAIAARIIRNVKFLDIYHKASDYDSKLTVSIGMACWDPSSPSQDSLSQSNEKALWLVRHADEALYRAKASGRNCAKL